MARLHAYSRDLYHKLANPPRIGENRHAWLYGIVASFLRQGADPEDLRRRLEAVATDAGWHDRVGQIAGDIAKLTSGRAPPSGPSVWMPTRDDKLRARIIADTRPRFGLTPTPLRATDVLPILFRPGEWVCMGQNEFRATTQRLEDVLPVAAHVAYVVANPMRADIGRTREGKPSPRSLVNATAPATRRYIVIEFDNRESLEDQARLLSALHTSEAPLALVIFSGGKSLHGWFNVASLPPSGKLHAFRRGALLGCDPSLWDRCKFVRMPGGLRNRDIRQPILYWEPEHAA